MTGLMLSGGTLLDPALRTTRRAEIRLAGGQIDRIAEEIRPEPGDEHLDCTGLFIAPAFIDVHAHVFDHGVYPGGVPADRIGVEQGVPCLLDAGSFGWRTADGFAEHVVRRARTRVCGLIHINAGLPRIGEGHSSHVSLLSLDGCVRAIERHRDWIRGVKVQASSSHVGDLDVLPVKLARKAAELTGLPLMVHIGNPPPLLEDVLVLLRSGDVVTHAAHGKTGGILGRDGVLLPEVRDAIGRGVLFDVGHGSSSFSFRVAERALAQGFHFDLAGTDLHRGNLDGPVVSLARTLTKLIALGVPWMDVIASTTSAPAAAFRLDGFGTLEEGRPANLTAFALEECAEEMVDAEGERRRATQRIRPLWSMLAGERFHVSAPL